MTLPLDVAPAPMPDLTTTTLVHRADKGGAWWRSAVVYQVYPRSFCDASGDGYGDLAGVTSKLDYLAALGVDAVWLSPFYTSPQADGGYDVANYRDVDPLFGTLADFDELLRRAHLLSMRVIIDLVPNHTSSEHPWFREALAAAPGSPQRARYIFREGTGPQGSEPPNDWTSVFGGSAWTRVTEADGIPGQWYLHLFDTRQPDLNWDNAQVRAEFEDVLRFWLDRGVDGFRVDVAHGMVKDPALPNLNGAPTKMEMDLKRLVTGAGDVGPMWDQEGVHQIIASWRAITDSYPGDRCLVAEAWVEPLDRLARYVRPGEMCQAFNFTYAVTPWFAPMLRAVVDASLGANDSVGAPTTWALNNHDMVRSVSRYGFDDPTAWIGGLGPGSPVPDAVVGLRRARAAMLLQLALPGVAYLYQGEEWGLPEDQDIAPQQRQDPTFARTGGERVGRDGCRVPLPWSSSEPAFGFSPTGRAWITQPASWEALALDRQKGDPSSTFELYRTALRLRRQLRLGDGSLAWVDATPRPALEGALTFFNRHVLVLANMSGAPVRLSADLDVLLASQELAMRDGAVEVPTDTTIWARTRG